jgi:uncharacterized protein (TIGR03546 family)
MIIWKIILKILKILHSEETPWQVAFGFSLGTIIAVTPFFSPHNLLVLLIIMVLNVSFPSALLGLTIMFLPGFALAPVSNKLGLILLTESPGLVPFWTAFFDIPGMAFSGLNNTYTLGSLVIALLLFTPLAVAVQIFVIRYRSGLKEKIAQTRLFRTISRSGIFIKGKKIYDLFGKGGYE